MAIGISNGKFSTNSIFFFSLITDSFLKESSSFLEILTELSLILPVVFSLDAKVKSSFNSSPLLFSKLLSSEFDKSWPTFVFSSVEYDKSIPLSTIANTTDSNWGSFFSI